MNPQLASGLQASDSPQDRPLGNVPAEEARLIFMRLRDGLAVPLFIYSRISTAPIIIVCTVTLAS